MNATSNQTNAIFLNGKPFVANDDVRFMTDREIADEMETFWGTEMISEFDEETGEWDYYEETVFIGDKNRFDALHKEQCSRPNYNPYL